MNILKTELDGVVVIEPRVFDDDRGFFFESYQARRYAAAGLPPRFVQDNHSFSQKGVLRGLHFQMHPCAQAKLVYAAYGSIFDVVVDIRKSSETFKQWLSVTLSDENRRMLYIPEGFAHGFMCLSDTAYVIYKCSAEYSPGHEAGIRWDDPDLAITWPAPNPILSEKDANNPYFTDAVLFEE